MYLRGIAGAGKSTFTNFITKYVFGMINSYYASNELSSNFNMNIMGKQVVVFEELNTGSSLNSWNYANDQLKKYADQEYLTFEQKHIQALQAKNIGTYFVLANRQVVKDSGRKIVSFDISTHRAQDFKYFKDLTDSCFNKKVGQCYISYLINKYADIINKGDYNLEDIPKTKSKEMAKALDVHTIDIFMYTTFYKKGDFIERKKTLFDRYVSFCSNNKISPCGYKEFHTRFVNVYNAETHRTNKYHCYKLTSGQLEALYKRHDWHLIECDEEDDEDENEELGDLSTQSLIAKVEIQRRKINTYKDELDAKKCELKRQQDEINELKKLLENSVTKDEPKNADEKSVKKSKKSAKKDEPKKADDNKKSTLLNGHDLLKPFKSETVKPKHISPCETLINNKNQKLKEKRKKNKPPMKNCFVED